MKFRLGSATVLTVSGAILIGLGLYFVLLRPPLLPEDLRYIGTTLAEIQARVPGLLLWLHRVFWVMGGYMVSAGVMTIYIARTHFKARLPGSAGVVAVAGFTSIGWMAAINFVIDSQFQWLIFAFAVVWSLALTLYWLEGRGRGR